MSFDELFAGLKNGASAQAAGLALGHGGAPPRAVSVRYGSARLRCASLLKPLYAWATARHADAWREYAEPAVRVSSNADTLRLWLGMGPLPILEAIRARTGVAWTPSPSDPAWFGSVEVAADEVVTAYAALAQAGAMGEPVAAQLLSWMREVPDDQAFGLRDVLPGNVAIKCGWYGGADETCLRTHAVAVLRGSGTSVTVLAALTAQPYLDEKDRTTYRANLATGAAVVDQHEKVAGPLLRGLMATTLLELGGPPNVITPTGTH